MTKLATSDSKSFSYSLTIHPSKVEGIVVDPETDGHSELAVRKWGADRSGAGL